MKTSCLVLMTFVLMSFGLSKKENGTVYYFCEARAKASNIEINKQLIVFTEVRRLQLKDGVSDNIAAQWSKASDIQYGNTQHHTSDFNSYKDEKTATEELQKMKQYYSDTTKYILKKVAFEPTSE